MLLSSLLTVHTPYNICRFFQGQNSKGKKHVFRIPQKPMSPKTLETCIKNKKKTEEWGFIPTFFCFNEIVQYLLIPSKQLSISRYSGTEVTLTLSKYDNQNFVIHKNA